MRVLLVEDDELVRRCLAAALAEAGLRVTELPDAERALALAGRDARPDLLVSDVNLGPGMDGLALAAEAHRRWPLIRVVLISGVPANLVGRPLLPSDRFLAKPFRTAALVRLVTELTAGSAKDRLPPNASDGMRTRDGKSGEAAGR